MVAYSIQEDGIAEHRVCVSCRSKYLELSRAETTNLEDGDVYAKLEDGSSNSPFTKRRLGTGGRSGSIAPILVGGLPGSEGAEYNEDGTFAMADDDYSAANLEGSEQEEYEVSSFQERLVANDDEHLYPKAIA
ncbi:hypothetical protein FRC09_000689 [Ceratobasidium sp. 395]|nr:hypothetical protein FRC09_000689 [Ceratobasidium sp. 395]